jgi:hypothetical protein
VDFPCRRRQHLLTAPLIGQRQAGRGDVEQLDTLRHQGVQQIGEVVVVHQGVGRRDENAPITCCSRSTMPTTS